MSTSKAIFARAVKSRERRGLCAGTMLLRCLGGEPLVVSTGPGTRAYQRKAWQEMHSVAHFWAAVIEFGGYPTPDKLIEFLHRVEQLCDQMQAKDEIRCPDPWRSPPDVRQHLISAHAAG